MTHQEMSLLDGGIWKGPPELLVLTQAKFIGCLTDK